MNPYGWKRGGPPGTSKKNIPIHKSSRPRTFYTPARRARTFYTPARRARTFYMSAQHFTRPRVARERRAAARGAEGVEPTYSRHYLIFNTFLQFRELTPHMGSIIWVETWRTPRDIQKKYSNTQIEQAANILHARASRANILHARASRANILHVRATFYTPARRAGTEGRGQGGRGG